MDSMRGYVQTRTGMQEIGYVMDHYHHTRDPHGHIHAANHPLLHHDRHHRAAGALAAPLAAQAVDTDAKAEVMANTRKVHTSTKVEVKVHTTTGKAILDEEKEKEKVPKVFEEKVKDTGGTAQIKAGPLCYY